MSRKFSSGEMAVEFRSKAPHKTCWLHVEYCEKDPPKALFKALEQVGWKKQDWVAPSALDGRMELEFNKPGTDLFGGWTPAERKKFMREARAVLYMQGFQRVNVHKMSLAELL